MASQSTAAIDLARFGPLSQPISPLLYRLELLSWLPVTRLPSRRHPPPLSSSAQPFFYPKPFALGALPLLPLVQALPAPDAPPCLISPGRRAVPPRLVSRRHITPVIGLHASPRRIIAVQLPVAIPFLSSRTPLSSQACPPFVCSDFCFLDISSTRFYLESLWVQPPSPSLHSCRPPSRRPSPRSSLRALREPR